MKQLVAKEDVFEKLEKIINEELENQSQVVEKKVKKRKRADTSEIESEDDDSRGTGSD